MIRIFRNRLFRESASSIKHILLRKNYWYEGNKTVCNCRYLTNSYARCYSSISDALKSDIMNNPARTSTVVLENFYVQVANYFKNPSYKLVKSFFKSDNGLWICKVTIQWPSYREFQAEKSKKTEAARIASNLAIEWLKSQEKIGDDGRPLLVLESNTFINLDLNAQSIDSIKELTKKFQDEITPLFDEIAKIHEDQNKIIFDEDDFTSKFFNLSEDEIEQRNLALFEKLMQIPAPSPLPIDALRDEIINTIQNNQVVVIKGHTGSGKTTRVPQIIFNSFIEHCEGAQCNIIVTQPRRISATSLASRIAFERNEEVGQSIGYHVRFNVRYPNKPGSVVFVSTGILLQRLLIDPDLNNVSHVIIDEAHERDVNIDLTLMLMKELIERNKNIRVIIMSATINPEIFQQYFNNCPLISVPGLMYDVKTHYINDIMLNTYFQNNCYEWDAVDIDDNLILNVVNWIHINKGPGAVLVFLPGWSDISKMQRILQENSDLVVVVAHSKLKIEQQQLIFEAPPPGKRKVILATNIAESSITIPDVVYVIDCGIVKETGNFNGITGLCNTWISKAVADQRKGRAGRLQEGECYRLYSKEKYESFDQYPIPEVMRTPLEKLIVTLKTYKSDPPWITLCKFPETPPRNSVEEAIAYLQGIAVLDNEENLTMLGKRIANFGLHPALSVALVYSVFFNCVNPMLLITSFLNGDANFFGIDVRSSKRRSILSEYHPANDNIAIYNFYQNWKRQTEKFIATQRQYDLNTKSMENFERILKLNADYLVKAHLLAPEEQSDLEAKAQNENDLNFIGPIFLASTGKLAVNSKPYSISGKANHYLTTLDGLKVQISNDSVNFKNSQSFSAFLTFYNMNTTEGFLRIYDTAPLSSVAVLLFCPFVPQICHQQLTDFVNIFYPNIGLPISAKSEALNALLHLRDVTWRSIDFFIHFHDAHCEELEKIQDFRKELRNLLVKLL